MAACRGCAVAVPWLRRGCAVAARWLCHGGRGAVPAQCARPRPRVPPHPSRTALPRCVRLLRVTYHNKRVVFFREKAPCYRGLRRFRAL